MPASGFTQPLENYMQDEKNKIERKKKKRYRSHSSSQGKGHILEIPRGCCQVESPHSTHARRCQLTYTHKIRIQPGTKGGDSTHPPWGQLVQAEGEDRGDPGLSLCLSPGHRDPKEQGGGLRRVMGELTRVMGGVRG